jgi:hypothetical protein
MAAIALAKYHVFGPAWPPRLNIHQMRTTSILVILAQSRGSRIKLRPFAGTLILLGRQHEPELWPSKMYVSTPAQPYVWRSLVSP